VQEDDQQKADDEYEDGPAAQFTPSSQLNRDGAGLGLGDEPRVHEADDRDEQSDANRDRMLQR
jgi:hypothetical protein